MWTKIYTFEENSIMNKKLTLFALFLFACSIALGAFGAHALKKIVIEKWQVAFETAVKYQFYASLLLLILSFQPVFNRFSLFFRVYLWTCSGRNNPCQVSFSWPHYPNWRIINDYFSRGTWN